MSNETAIEKAKPTAMELLTAVLSQPNPKDAVEIVKELALLHREEMKRHAEQAFHEAVARFKENAPKVIKNRENSAFKRGANNVMYADLNAWLDAVTPALSKEGLSVNWKYPQQTDKWVNVTCVLKHELGHFEEATLGAPPTTATSNAQTAPQLVAITVKYMQRYTLAAILGMDAGDTDTDGNMAVNNGELVESIEWIENSGTVDEVVKMFKLGYEKFESSPAALKALIAAKNKRKKELQ